MSEIPEAPSSARTILIAEDDADAREQIRLLLERQGYRVRTAGNGQEALNLLRADPPPELILLDLMMPVLDGWEVRRRQLADPALAAIPVVVLTAVNETDRLGDVGYLLKPIDPDELLAVLQRFLAPRRPGILVVDDEPAILRMLEVFLSHHGFAVQLAGSGREAVELFQRRLGEVDAVLLDVQMPGMDGPRTFTTLQGINPSLRCIFMSAHTGVYSNEQLLALGAVSVLTKPFPSLDHLVGVLRETIRPLA
jgi:CheY-like chemotaxis protein